MQRDMGKRIVRPATPDEKERQELIRKAIDEELPDLKKWAQAAAANKGGKVSVGAIFSPEEAKVVQAIDEYATAHSLPNRGAVVRQALAQLLGIELSAH